MVGGALAIVMVAIGIATAVAAEPADPSDVVVALDFSHSILDDRPNRTRFADALDEIAAGLAASPGSTGALTGSLSTGGTGSATRPRSGERSRTCSSGPIDIDQHRDGTAQVRQWHVDRCAGSGR